MRIKFAAEPIAGQDFEFEVHDTEGESSIRVYIGDTLTLESTCPEPPCHERVFVPFEAGGETLLIRAQDMQGLSEHVFGIKAEDLDSGAQTATAGD